MDEPQAVTENGNGGYTAPDAYPGFKPPEPHELPSGATFLLRKPQIMKMLRKGQLPNPLMQIVEDTFRDRDRHELKAEAELKGVPVEQVLEERAQDAETEREATPPVPEPERDEVELTAKDGFAFMDVIVWASIAAPRVEMGPPVGNTPLTASGALSYDVIADDDIQYILRWANGGADELATFPAGERRESGGGDGGKVRDAPERAVGDPA